MPDPDTRDLRARLADLDRLIRDRDARRIRDLEAELAQAEARASETRRPAMSRGDRA